MSHGVWRVELSERLSCGDGESKTLLARQTATSRYLHPLCLPSLGQW